MNFDHLIRTKLTIVDEYHLTQYLAIIANASTEGYCEEHHILPQALWPEYKNKHKHPENIVKLPLREHLLAHYYFSKATNTLWNAIPAIAYATSNGARLLQEYDLSMIEIAMREYKENCRGKNHPRYGLTHSDDTKQKISKANTGNTWSDTRKAEHSAKLKGRTKPAGFGAKISKARRGSTHTQETKQLMSKQRTGRKLTDEWKQNISKAQTGLKKAPCSEQRKETLSKERAGSGNPMFGKKHTVETKEQMAKTAQLKRKKKWGQLYGELHTLWVQAETPSAYKFSKWLETNTTHRYSQGQLSGLVEDYLQTR